MAFQTPTRARRQLSLSRHLQLSYQKGYQSFTGVASSVTQQPLTPETEEWIVFSPSTAGDTNTILSGTNQLDSATSSSPRRARYGVIPGALGEYEEEEDEEEYEESLDGAETDSLQPFRDQEGPVLLPTHDGLGTFHSSPGIGFRSLEESLRIVALRGDGSGGIDTHSRIQRWRVEQGNALMDEIERATRRRRQLSLANQRDGQLELDSELDETASMGDLTDGRVRTGDDPSSDAPEAIPKATTDTRGEGSETTNETFWQRITRSFIRDIIGIDDHLLEVLFGEALPVETQLDSSLEDTQVKKVAEERILSRIAKELGELVHLYTQHPSGTGAFSTLRRPSQDEDQEDDGAKTPQPHSIQTDSEPQRKRQRGTSFTSVASGSSSVPQFQFSPTLASRQEEASHASLWGIEEESEDLKNAQLRREYWEQELDVRLVFSYLKSRFYGLPRPATAPSSTADSSAPLHHHHPLINHKHSGCRRASVTAPKPTTGARTGTFSPLMGKQGGGSCASHDRVAKDRRSSKASSRSKGYYWDIASSVGSGQTGSCIGTGLWAAI